MDDRRGLDHPDDARFAWARFRRILRYMNIVALALSLASVAFLASDNYGLPGHGLPWIFAGLTFAGVYGTIMMAAALMGLMFLSNGTGHDANVINLDEGAHPLDD